MTIVNLNKARKAKARSEKTQRADANSVKFGQTKAQKQLLKNRSDIEASQLDAHRRES
ncbi:MAG: DUF4169 family protein [Boseongicola sp.]|nr:DUF4169 family protein [Boseongicola sp.]